MREIEPPGYTLASDLFGDFDEANQRFARWRWLILGNLWALLPLALAVLILWLPYQFYAALGAPLALWSDPDWSAAARWIVGAGIIAASIALHEGLHALALLALGYRAKLRYSGGYFYATTDGYMTRRDYLMMVLTPITTMTLGGGVLLLFLPVVAGQMVLVSLLLNAAASVGDLTVAERARRQPADALFADRQGIKVFLRAVEGADYEAASVETH